MQSLQARIDSFQKTRRIKRYPKRPSSSAVTLKWPHSPSYKANANTLAEAGFFFSPSWDARDNVACFLCGKELDDWDETDDPFEIHFTKCKASCAWALVRCGLTEDVDNEGRFVFDNKSRLPSSRMMEKARLETFGKDWWPHDEEPGHCATSTKMAQAGFVYTPQAAGDDTVTCLYCNLSLGGWEKQDDPVQEHCSRDSKSGAACPFLRSSSKQTRSSSIQPDTEPPPPRAKRGKTRSTTSTTSSKPRRRTKTTRGKSVKGSTSNPRRSPSPSQAISHEPEGADDLMAVDVPEPPTSIVEPITGDSIPSEPSSSSGPDAPSNHDTPPDTMKPDPVVSLPSVGQPTIASSESLTPHERAMSLEQWIRQEINISYDRLLADGRRQIDLFKTKAAEIRRCIDEL